MAVEMFDEQARPAGDIAGVFEYDGETGYFYLWDKTRRDSKQIAGAIHITSRAPDFQLEDLEIAWDRDHKFVGLLIHHRLWAVFAVSGEAYGGGYKPGCQPQLPTAIAARFQHPEIC